MKITKKLKTKISLKDKVKLYCKLIGCSGIRKECLNGDVNCNIIKPFINNKKEIQTKYEKL